MGYFKYEESENYRNKMQSHLTNTIENATPNGFIDRKKNRLGKATAKLLNAGNCYSTQIELTTEEKTALSTDFNRQLEAIKTVTSSRFVDVFDLLLEEIAKDIGVNKHLDLNTLQEHTCFSLNVDEVCKRFGITYKGALNLLNDVSQRLISELHFVFRDLKNKKSKLGEIRRFNAVEETSLKKNMLTVRFTGTFIKVLAFTGNRRPTLIEGMDYNPKQLKYMGQLRNKLEDLFFENELNAGKYQRVKLANILPIFSSANMAKNPLQTFINPLKRHLSHLEETGLFKCKFTGAKGALLPSIYRDYLEVTKEGELIKDLEAGDGVKSVPRIKVNELLNNVYLSYTYLDRPEMKITKKTAQQRRAKEKTAKNRTE